MKRVSGNIWRVPNKRSPNGEEYVIRNPVTGYVLCLPLDHVSVEDIRALAARIEALEKGGAKHEP